MPGNIHLQKVALACYLFSLCPLILLHPVLNPALMSIGHVKHLCTRRKIMQLVDVDMVPRNFPISLPHAPCSGQESNIGKHGIWVHVTEEFICRRLLEYLKTV